MIRQNIDGWRVKLQSLSTQDRDNLLRDLASKQEEYKAASDALSKKYKQGQISTLAELDSLSKTEFTKFEQWALSNGYYEDVTQDKIDSEQNGQLIDFIKTRPDDTIITIITAIANYLRSKEGKEDITEDQLMKAILSL